MGREGEKERKMGRGERRWKRKMRERTAQRGQEKRRVW